MRDWKKWAYYALIRAVKTFAQAAVSMIAVGAAFSEIDFVRVISCSGVAFLLSWLTSFAGLPESPDEMTEPAKTEQPDE